MNCPECVSNRLRELFSLHHPHIVRNVIWTAIVSNRLRELFSLHRWGLP